MVNGVKKTNRKDVKKIVLFALLTAILIAMAFTPIGYLRIGVVEITFMMIPVIVGACAYGAVFGAGLGLIFGLTSFLQCFGMSAFGTMLFNINPWLSALLCLLPRIAFGFISGLIYKGLSKTRLPRTVSGAITMLSGAIIHTLLFVTLFYLCFGKSAEFAQYGNNFFNIVWALVGVNGIVEWSVCLVVGTAILRAVQYFFVDERGKNKHRDPAESEKSK